MKCPLRKSEFQQPSGAHGVDMYDCLKEECAWWQGDDEVCWIVQIGIALSILATNSYPRKKA